MTEESNQIAEASTSEKVAPEKQSSEKAKSTAHAPSTATTNTNAYANGKNTKREYSQNKHYKNKKKHDRNGKKEWITQESKVYEKVEKQKEEAPKEEDVSDEKSSSKKVQSKSKRYSQRHATYHAVPNTKKQEEEANDTSNGEKEQEYYQAYNKQFYPYQQANGAYPYVYTPNGPMIAVPIDSYYAMSQRNETPGAIYIPHAYYTDPHAYQFSPIQQLPPYYADSNRQYYAPPFGAYNVDRGDAKSPSLNAKAKEFVPHHFTNQRQQ